MIGNSSNYIPHKVHKNMDIMGKIIAIYIYIFLSMYIVNAVDLLNSRV